MIAPENYIPRRLHENYGLPLPQVPTSWNGLEKVIPDIIERFSVDRTCAVEFGVWHGYSTAALANNFETVYGVEPFTGDRLPGTEQTPMIETTFKTLIGFPDITLVEMGYREFLELEMPEPKPLTGLVHIDVVHTYEMTFDCGWRTDKILNPRVILFHDTRSPDGRGDVFEPVMQAVADLAELTGRKFYEFNDQAVNPHGLGILVRE